MKKLIIPDKKNIKNVNLEFLSVCMFYLKNYIQNNNDINEPCWGKSGIKRSNCAHTIIIPVPYLWNTAPFVPQSTVHSK